MPQALQAETLTGNDNPNLLAGSAAATTIQAKGGDDTLWGDPAVALRVVERSIASSDQNGSPATSPSGGSDAETGDNAVFSPGSSQVAFTSEATNLVPGVSGRQVYMKNLRTGAIRLISAGTDGTPLMSASNPTFSPDARFIAFSGKRDPDVPFQIYVKDLASGVLTNVTTDSNGNELDGDGLDPVFTPRTGRLVFVLASNRLGRGDILRKDLASGALTNLVSREEDPSSEVVFCIPYCPLFHDLSVSPNERYLAFGEASGEQDSLRVFDTALGTQIPFGADTESQSSAAIFSPDSAKILFESFDSLLAEDTNVHHDIYEMVISTRALRLVSTTSHGKPANEDSYDGFYSPDGAFVIFRSFATNLVANSSGSRLYAKDRTTGVAYLLDNRDGDNLGIAPNSRRYAYTTFPDTAGATSQTWVATFDVPLGGDDRLEAGLGADVLVGGPGNDKLIGDFGLDRLFGGEGDDILGGGPDFDVVNGGPGVDTLSLAAATASVRIELMGDARAKLTIGNIADDAVSSVEDVIGGIQNDDLRGDKKSNVLEGGPGNDMLRGDSAGDADGILTAIDFASYEHAGAPVTLVFRNGTVVGRSTGTDRFSASKVGSSPNRFTIEGVIGSRFNDNLNGAGIEKARLEGGPGNDILTGGTPGSQRVVFRTATHGVQVNLAAGISKRIAGAGIDSVGSDTLRGIRMISGSRFADVLVGDGNPNVINSSGGPDQVTGGGGADEFNYFFELESPASAPDTIRDFSFQQSDFVDVAGLCVTQWMQGGFGTSPVKAARFVRSGTGGELHLDLDSDPQSEMIIRLANVTSFGGTSLRLAKAASCPT